MYFCGYCDRTYQEYLIAEELQLEAADSWLNELVSAVEVTRGSTQGISTGIILSEE